MVFPETGPSFGTHVRMFIGGAGGFGGYWSLELRTLNPKLPCFELWVLLLQVQGLLVLGGVLS